MDQSTKERIREGSKVFGGILLAMPVLLIVGIIAVIILAVWSTIIFGIFLVIYLALDSIHPLLPIGIGIIIISTISFKVLKYVIEQVKNKIVFSRLPSEEKERIIKEREIQKKIDFEEVQKIEEGREERYCGYY